MLRWADGFEDLPSAIADRYDYISYGYMVPVPQALSGKGRFGGSALAFYDNWQFVRNYQTNENTVGPPCWFGFAFNPQAGNVSSALFADAPQVIRLLSLFTSWADGPDELGWFSYNETGRIEVWGGRFPPPPITCIYSQDHCPNTIELIDVSSQPLRSGVYSYVELKYGYYSYEVWVNGEQWMGGSIDFHREYHHHNDYDPDHEPEPLYAHGWWCDSANLTYWNLGPAPAVWARRTFKEPILFDDLYMVDSLEPAGYCYERLGDLRIQTKLPTGDGVRREWNSTGGLVHYTEVDDANADDPWPTKVLTQVVGKRDTYTYDDFQPAETVWTMFMRYVAAAQGQEGYSFVDPLVVQGGVDWVSTWMTAYVWAHGEYLVPIGGDPDGNPWTVENVNGSEFGMQVTGMNYEDSYWESAV